MSENYAVEWARKVVACGRPAKDLPPDAKREAYEELAAAYHVLAEEALAGKDLDRYVTLSELAEQGEAIAGELRAPEERR